MNNIIIFDNPKKFPFNIHNATVISTLDYLTQLEFADMRNVRIFNLSKSYRYQSWGYYTSLLAEARGHKVFPNIATLQDFNSKAMLRIIPQEIDELIQTKLARIKANEFILSIYFGKNMASQYDRLCRQLYTLFPCPLLRAKFVFTKKWILHHISPISMNDIAESHFPYIVQFAKEYFSRKKFRPFKENRYVYDMAILINPKEPHPPSNKQAIQYFIKASREIGFNTELITKEDFSRLSEFDALFIRETTAVNHHTYRFSRKASKEGLAVLDDPWSILKCSNKVYLTELLKRQRIAIPETFIINKKTSEEVIKKIRFPCILKKPDSSFSHGVVKVNDSRELALALKELLEDSDLILAQEFIPTEFDWRIGVLDRQPLFACKYFMAHEHWQIYNWSERNEDKSTGDTKTFQLDQVPHKVMDMAVRAANAVGDGLYGVDLKQIGSQVVIMEINDNPNIDHGIEDCVLKEELYLSIMKSFLNRLRNKI